MMYYCCIGMLGNLPTPLPIWGPMGMPPIGMPLIEGMVMGI